MKSLSVYPYREASLVALSCLVAGCTTTGDPAQGGLFGWSPAKADQRVASYQAEFRREERRLDTKQNSANRLQHQKKALQTQIDDANTELTLLLEDVQQIEGVRDTSLSNKAAALKDRIQTTRDSGSPEERQVRALRREVDLLREEMRLLQQR